MFESALIVFREGLESFLIIALIVAYLRQTGKTALTPAVYGGAVAALVFSAGIGVVTDELAESPFSEGMLALISGALVASLTIHVMRTAKIIRSSVTSKIDTHIAKATIPALIGLFLFTFLMVAREGVETALMLSSLAQDSTLATILGGTSIGLCATGLIGFLWVRYAHLINLKLFLQTTGVFLIAFALHIALYGLHELSEADALPFIDNFAFHTATEIIEPNSTMGQILLYVMIAVPCLWLAFGIVQDKLKKLATPQ